MSIQLLQSVLQIKKGNKQKKEAREIAEKNVRPDMPIPSAILENQKMAKSMAQEGMPSEQYTKGLKNIDRSAVNALRGAIGRRGGLMAVGQVQATTNDALGNLNVQDANMRQRNQMNLINQTNQLGRYQQNAWDWNKRQKFIETAASASALMGAGNMNVNQGVDRIFSSTQESLDKLASVFSGGTIKSSSKPSYESGNPTTYGQQGGYSQFQTDFND